MARILLFGARGMLGSALARVLGPRHEVATPNRDAFDIVQARWSTLDVKGFDWVLNAAGLIDRRAPSAAERCTVNAVFPHALQALCARERTRLLHFSTDCVFDGARGCHDEAAIPDASDPYGRSKRLGEPPGAMVLRCSIIGPEQRHFYNLLCWCLRQSSLDGYLNHRWNGVTTLALAHAVQRIVAKDLFAPGVRHVFAEDTTKYHVLTLICRGFGHRAAPRPAQAAMPRDTRLRTRDPAFLAALGLPPLEAQIAALPPLATSSGAWRAA